MRLFSLMLATLLAVPSLAQADEDSPQQDEDSTDDTSGGFVGVGTVAPTDEALQEVNAWELLGRVPPNESWDFGVQLSYGQVGYFRDLRTYAGPSGGLGLRAAYGRHVGRSRYGVQVDFGVEGPLPIYLSTVVEAMPSWDYINRKMLIGFSIGPALMMHSGFDQDITFTGTGVAAVRMGFSQNWTKTGQRLFVVFEPRVRLIRGEPSYSVNLIVGQGKGR